jgi:addiction module HigA family antidote
VETPSATEFRPPSITLASAGYPLLIEFARLDAIVKGRRAVSADTALLLEALTRWDAEIWLRLQAKWDLWHAVQARGPRPKVRALPRSA